MHNLTKERKDMTAAQFKEFAFLHNETVKKYVLQYVEASIHLSILQIEQLQYVGFPYQFYQILDVFFKHQTYIIYFILKDIPITCPIKKKTESIYSWLRQFHPTPAIKFAYENTMDTTIFLNSIKENEYSIDFSGNLEKEIINICF